jgi:hypothetical protein
MTECRCVDESTQRHCLIRRSEEGLLAKNSGMLLFNERVNFFGSPGSQGGDFSCSLTSELTLIRINVALLDK